MLVFGKRFCVWDRGGFFFWIVYFLEFSFLGVLSWGGMRRCFVGSVEEGYFSFRFGEVFWYWL